MNDKLKTILKEDPRIPLLSFFLLYLYYLINSPVVGRTFLQAVATVTFAICFDLLYNYKKHGSLRFPTSSILSTMGILFLVFSKEVWPFVFIAFLSIFSKFLIKSENRHIYNPNNFGISIAFLLMGDTVTTTVARWNSNFLLLLIFALMGIYMAWRVSRLHLCVSYITTYLIMSGLLAFMTDTSYIIHYGPITGPVFYLFTFFHITDPKTSPSGKKEMILFGIAIGLIQGLLRWNFIRYSGFFAYFIVCSLYPLLHYLPLHRFSLKVVR